MLQLHDPRFEDAPEIFKVLSEPFEVVCPGVLAVQIHAPPAVGATHSDPFFAGHVSGYSNSFSTSSVCSRSA